MGTTAKQPQPLRTGLLAAVVAIVLADLVVALPLDPRTPVQQSLCEEGVAVLDDPNALWTDRRASTMTTVGAFADLALSPDGSTLYLVHHRQGFVSLHQGQFDVEDDEVVVTALDSSSGCELWETWVPSAIRVELAHGLAVSPDGNTLAVVGTIEGLLGGFDAAIAALDAATGALRWQDTYAGPAARDDALASVAFSLDSTTIFAGGATGIRAALENPERDALVLAYAAEDGTRRWAFTFDSPQHGEESVGGLFFAATGQELYAAGSAEDPGAATEYLMFALSAQTGETAWLQRASFADDAVAHSVVLAPNGATALFGGDRGVVALAAATGLEVWRSPMDGAPNADFLPFWVATSPDGSRAFLGGVRDEDFLARALDSATGAVLWESGDHGGGAGLAGPLGFDLSPAGDRIALTGLRFFGIDSDYATVVLDAATGSTLRAFRYDSPTGTWDMGLDVQFSVDGSRVYVTGVSELVGSDANWISHWWDELTFAYEL